MSQLRGGERDPEVRTAPPHRSPGKGDGGSGVTPPSPPARERGACTVSECPGRGRAGSNAEDEILARPQ